MHNAQHAETASTLQIAPHNGETGSFDGRRRNPDHTEKLVAILLQRSLADPLKVHIRTMAPRISFFKNVIAKCYMYF